MTKTKALEQNSQIVDKIKDIAYNRGLRTSKRNCESGEGFVKICRVIKHVWEMDGNASARWMSHISQG
jgi:hypothetical protein